MPNQNPQEAAYNFRVAERRRALGRKAYFVNIRFLAQFMQSQATIDQVFWPIELVNLLEKQDTFFVSEAIDEMLRIGMLTLDPMGFVWRGMQPLQDKNFPSGDDIEPE